MMRRHFDWVMAGLGSIASAGSVINLVRQAWHVRLADLPARYLDFYQDIIHRAVGWIPLPFHWVIPIWYANCMVIAFVLMVTLFRTEHLAPIVPVPELYGQKDGLFSVIGGVAVGTILAPLALVSLAIGLGRAIASLGASPMERNWADGFPSARQAGLYWLRTFAVLLAVTLISTVLFFFLNAQIA